MNGGPGCADSPGTWAQSWAGLLLQPGVGPVDMASAHPGCCRRQPSSEWVSRTFFRLLVLFLSPLSPPPSVLGSAGDANDGAWEICPSQPAYPQLLRGEESCRGHPLPSGSLRQSLPTPLAATPTQALYRQWDWLSLRCIHLTGALGPRGACNRAEGLSSTEESLSTAACAGG